MILEQAKKLLAQAAAPTLARIRKDRDGAPEKLIPLLDHLSKRLFDPGLNVNRLKLACGVRDNSISIVFHDHLGATPHSYISRARLATAERLLASSDLKIWLIAEMVGYAGLSAFARAFERYYGQRPRAYRQSLAESRGNEVSTSAPSKARGTAATIGRHGIEARALRQAQSGNLRPVEPLLAWLEHLYPREPNPVPARKLHGFERMVAEKLWRRVRELPEAEQHEAVAAQITFRSTALFDLLREESRKIGRLDRRRGVATARLALTSLETVALPAESLPDLEARAWAWIANAERLAHDLPAAERALSRAEQAWCTAEVRDPLIEAELLHVETALRISQNRFQDALRLAERAEVSARQAGDPVLTARSLTLRGTIHWQIGEYQASLQDLRGASDAMSGRENADLSFSIITNLAAAYISLGRVEEARAPLEEAKLGIERLENPAWKLQLTWIEGLLHRTLGQDDLAESYLRQAYDGLCRLGEMGLASYVGLDLGILLAARGKQPEAFRVTGQILPLFEQLQMPQESFAALGVLRNAVESREVSASILQSFRQKVPGLGFMR